MSTKSSELMALLAIVVSISINVGAFAGVVPEMDSVVVGIPIVPPTIPPNLEFLSSDGALRAHAVEMGRQARVGVGMNSSTESQTTSVGSWDRPMNSLEVNRFMDGLFDGLWIKPANPNDWVWAFGVIMTAEGEDLLYGWGGTDLKPGKGGSAELEPFGVTYRLAPTICIPFPGIDSAEMLIVDTESGRTANRVDLGVAGGKFCFQTDMAGKGYLVIRTRDGQTLVYDLAGGGMRVSPERIEFAGKVTSVIADMVTIVNPVGAYGYVVPSQDGVGVNPTFEVIIDFELKESQIDLTVASSENAQPIAFMVRAQGNPHWKMVPVEGGRLYIPGPLERAVYYAVPVWNPAEFRTREPYTDGPVAVPVVDGVKG